MPRPFEEGDLVRFWTIEEARAENGPSRWKSPQLPWGEIGEVMEAGIEWPLWCKSPRVLFKSGERVIGPRALTLVEAYDPTKELGEDYFQ